MPELSLSEVLGIVAFIAAFGFAVLALLLNRASGARRDAPSGTPAVIKSYWVIAVLFLVAGGLALIY